MTVFLTVAGQVIIKWQITKAGVFPDNLSEKVVFLLHLLLNPWIIASLAGALVAALAWMAAMTKFELSQAYPFMSLSFIFVMIFSSMLLDEQLSLNKILGTILVIGGLIVIAR
jgi:drug/metabolite transporter (DMT)-like permease